MNYASTSNAFSTTATAGGKSQAGAYAPPMQQQTPFTSSVYSAQAQYPPPQQAPVEGAFDEKIVQRSFPALQIHKNKASNDIQSLKNVGYPDISLSGAYPNQSNASISLGANYGQVTYQSTSQGASQPAGAYNPWPATTANTYAAPSAYSTNVSTSGYLPKKMQSPSSISLPAKVSSVSPPNNYVPNNYGGVVASTYNNSALRQNFQPANVQSTSPYSVARLQESYQQSSSSVSGGSRSQTHSRSATPERSQSGMRNSKSTPDLTSLESAVDFQFSPSTSTGTAQVCSGRRGEA